MTQTISTNRLGRLNILRDTLIDLCQQSVKDADEWQTYQDILTKVRQAITAEQRRQGYMAVYPIVDGCARESLFEGTQEQCKIYTDILLESHPEMKGNIIVLEL